MSKHITNKEPFHYHHHHHSNTFSVYSVDIHIQFELRGHSKVEETTKLVSFPKHFRGNKSPILGYIV